jgi:hypothetical protein
MSDGSDGSVLLYQNNLQPPHQSEIDSIAGASAIDLSLSMTDGSDRSVLVALYQNNPESAQQSEIDSITGASAIDFEPLRIIQHTNRATPPRRFFRTVWRGLVHRAMGFYGAQEIQQNTRMLS